MERQIREIAKENVKKKKGFYSHLSAYIAVGGFFFIMNMVTSGGGPNPDFWFFYPMLPWGIGLVIHYFSVFGLPWNGALSAEWEEAEMEKEMDKVRKTMQQYQQLPSAEEPVDPEDFFDLNKKPIKEEQKPGWDNKDLV